ncbi:MAG: heme anaerobic degradation radical SAM methyltransferase ChuW/HutW [Desulfomicrobium sp.]|nr:heme anaerobic degradation radical SAM methyltransferase ChuW/HutW [Desulfomicrobium sp.]
MSSQNLMLLTFEHDSHIQACFARENEDPLGQAFERKMAIHAGFSGTPVPNEHIDDHLEKALRLPRVGKSAAYIHVPFCETHCLYCGFYTRAYGSSESSRYVDALLAEVDLWRETAAFKSAPIHALYIGGGTPTSLEANDLRRLIIGLGRSLPLANDCEITLEGRIHNFGPDKMEACLVAGVNRFSLGVQTFDTELRQSMGRKAGSKEIQASLRRLLDYDQAAVVIDLIYGFPGQTMDMWRTDLDILFDLELDGVDLYQLNLLKDTPLFRAVKAGKVSAPLDIAAQGQMYAMGSSVLAQNRWQRLSASHWGRTTRERNVYNHMVKGQSYCLGFGPGAGGVLDDCSYFVRRDYAGWLEEVGQGRKPVAAVMLNPKQAVLAKPLAQSFDRGRINLSRLGQALSLPLADLAQPITDQWARAGLVHIDGEWLDLTVAGHFWQVTMAHLLITFFNQIIEEEALS